jgi:hypothetical protein
MEVICSFEMSVDFQRITLYYIPEDGTVLGKLIYEQEKTIIIVYSKQIWK